MSEIFWKANSNGPSWAMTSNVISTNEITSNVMIASKLNSNKVTSNAIRVSVTYEVFVLLRISFCARKHKECWIRKSIENVVELFQSGSWDFCSNYMKIRKIFKVENHLWTYSNTNDNKITSETHSLTWFMCFKFQIN